MDSNTKNYFQFSFWLILCLLIRLIPFRVPNVEPILATMMPFSRAYGAFIAFSFAVLSILLFDFITGTFGIHTFFTTFAYGVLGLWSASYFKKEKVNIWNYVYFAIVGTLFFDIFTGLILGPLIFHQSFVLAFVGQVPFTLLHLAGNIIFALLLSPAVDHYLIRKKKNIKTSIISTLSPKII